MAALVPQSPLLARMLMRWKSWQADSVCLLVPIGRESADMMDSEITVGSDMQ